MLLTRFITALVLLPPVVAAILLLPTAGVAIILGAVLSIGAWEWSLLMCLQDRIGRIVYVALAAVVLMLMWLGLGRVGLVAAVLWVSVLWWAAAVSWLARFPHGLDLSVAARPVGALMGLLVLAGAFAALVDLHSLPDGPLLVLLLFVLIWAADTGAYFAGRLWGRNKLAPAISPGKTREGAIGGVILTALAAALGAWWLEYEGARLVLFLALGAVTAMISIVGDLTISMFKRQAGVKDAGSLFPGHGGVLDRLDSMVAAAPVFVLGLGLLPA